ncbi:MAG TPA: endopeptidase La [Gemmatimonadaceae bacterium]|nr:endopeptidase La [Gemmatimonadaceae bacterium]
MPSASSAPPPSLQLARDDETFDVPERLPVLPLRDVVVFPYMLIPLLVGRAGSLAAVEAAADRWIFLVAQRDPAVQEPASADLHRVGVVGRILQLVHRPNGTTKVLVEGVARARVTRYAARETLLRATIAADPLARWSPDAVDQAMARRVVTQFEEYVGMHRRLPAEVVTVVQEADSAAKQAFAIAAHLLVRSEMRQELLEVESLAALYERISAILSSEIELLRLERKIENDVRGSLFQNQREFYLHEQLKAIHRELGQDESDSFDELDALIASKHLPRAAAERATHELRKLRRTPAMSPEYTVGRNYLEWLLALPWTERTDAVLDVGRAQVVLDEDHFGLDEVKDRILDYLAVLALVGHLEGPILCLVGPPGVGKTSLGRSVARALGRTFVRMSLGGVRDEAEIRGHRRTYIGSQPGRVIQAMRRAQVVNPVLLLDEVDKMGQDWRGDPAAALLEVLDPEQNRTFSDHYLEVDYDLSQVLFITTANTAGQIPEALRDRMEVIRLPGYVDHEKHAIARQFLIPRQLRSHGLDPARVTWEPGVVPEIVQRYTREAGVRELERRIARVARKLARRIAAGEAGLTVPAATPSAGGGAAASTPSLAVDEDSGEEPASAPAANGAENGREEAPANGAREAPPPHPPMVVRTTDLVELLGVPSHDWERPSVEDRVGVATGLAYTQVGGELLEIEVAIVRGRGKLQLTGTLGDVLKESANAALTYARARADALGIDPDFHLRRDVHVHIPSGATPKDGPSAGIAIATAMVSALSGVPTRGDVAMTGEVTLRGRILPIGGLKEKAVAAIRSGVAHVIIPAANARELSELPEDIRSRLEFHPCSVMDDVLELALLREPPDEHTTSAPARRASRRSPPGVQPPETAH